MHASKYSGGLAVLSLNGDVNAIWVSLANGTGFAGAKKRSVLSFRSRRGDRGIFLCFKRRKGEIPRRVPRLGSP